MTRLNRWYLREAAILAGLGLATIIMLYPLSVNPGSMVPEPSDPLLNVWRMHWDKYALLSGPVGVANLFNANIFYPYPLTLAFSEHFLMHTMLALPVLLLADSHLLGMNLSVLLSFVLTGYAMYLLVAEWTRQRWAGLAAGFLVAFAPFRFGQINHLELLAMQWMPLTLLSLHWALTRSRWVYLGLLVLFFNLQSLSAIYYTFHLALACGLLAGAYLALGWIKWRWGLARDLGILCAVTLAVNWPIWQVYLRFSQVMGAERTPGEVRVYSAAFMDYLTALPNNLLYGWTFGRWQPAGHQFQPLMPLGVVGIVLAVLGLVWAGRQLAARRRIGAAGLFLGLLVVAGFVLSLGINDEAFGAGLKPVLARLLPYPWLYEHVPGFRGLRVPARYAALVSLGLAALAGIGFAALRRWLARTAAVPIAIKRLGAVALVVLLGLAALEYWSVPLAGPTVAYGSAIPAVYRWLAQTPPGSVVLELPYQDASEFAYEYYSTYHWRPLVNGGTGYTPPIYRQLRQWFATFPDWRSVDILQQLGVDDVVLHQPEVNLGQWNRIRSELPAYLPAFDQIHQVGQSVVLHVADAPCRTDASQVTAALSRPAGQPGTAALTLRNTGATAFVADVSRVSTLSLDGHPVREFLEPLLLLPDAAQTLEWTLDGGDRGQLQAHLATLERTVDADAPQPPAEGPAPATEIPEQPVALHFQGGAGLAGIALLPERPYACGALEVRLHWQPGVPDDTVLVTMIDRFGRTVLESRSQPWRAQADAVIDVHRLALPGALPAGAYGLKLRVQPAGGGYRPVVNAQGTVIPPESVPAWPVVIQPAAPGGDYSSPPLAAFADGVDLLQAHLAVSEAAAGDWLRFTLAWRAWRQPIQQDVTVFTQLVGPDGGVWGQQDNPPRGGWYPVSLWQPGQVVLDDFAFAVNPDAPPGDYQLVVGLYDSRTIQRLPARLAAGTETDAVAVSPVTIRPHSD